MFKHSTERVLECCECWEYPGKFLFLSAFASLHAGCCSVNLCVPGQAVVMGNPTMLCPVGTDDFLRKLLAEKMSSLRCLLLGAQQQAKQGTWLSAEVARIGRDSWLGVHGQVLCPPSRSPAPSSWKAILVPPPVSPCPN